MNSGISRIECKKIVNFGPLTKMSEVIMLTHSKLTLHIWHMMMHLSSGYVTATRGISNPKFFPQLDLQCQVDSHWSLPQNFIFLCVGLLSICSHSFTGNLKKNCFSWFFYPTQFCRHQIDFMDCWILHHWFYIY